MNYSPRALLREKRSSRRNAREGLSADTCRYSTARAKVTSCWVKVSGMFHRLRQGAKNLHAKMRLDTVQLYILAGYLSCGRDEA